MLNARVALNNVEYVLSVNFTLTLTVITIVTEVKARYSFVHSSRAIGIILSGHRTGLINRTYEWRCTKIGTCRSKRSKHDDVGGPVYWSISSPWKYQCSWLTGKTVYNMTRDVSSGMHLISFASFSSRRERVVLPMRQTYSHFHTSLFPSFGTLGGLGSVVRSPVKVVTVPVLPTLLEHIRYKYVQYNLQAKSFCRIWYRETVATVAIFGVCPA